MAHLQHRLAVVKVVTRQQLVEPDQVLFQVPQLRVVEFLEERRDGFRGDHGRETREETGLEEVEIAGPIRIIDWHFRFRGKAIHKFCHFFLMESKGGDPKPQADEGITDYVWVDLDKALEKLSYDNARGVLRRAGEMTRTLVAVGAGRSPGSPPPRIRGEAPVPVPAVLPDPTES